MDGATVHSPGPDVHPPYPPPATAPASWHHTSTWLGPAQRARRAGSFRLLYIGSGSALSRHHPMVKGQHCVRDLVSGATHSPKLLTLRALYCQSLGVRTPVIQSLCCSRFGTRGGREKTVGSQ